MCFHVNVRAGRTVGDDDAILPLDSFIRYGFRQVNRDEGGLVEVGTGGRFEED